MSERRKAIEQAVATIADKAAQDFDIGQKKEHLRVEHKMTLFARYSDTWVNTS